LKLYILQLVFNDDVGTIKSVNATKSLTSAERWNHKKLRTTSYFHGYQELEV